VDIPGLVELDGYVKRIVWYIMIETSIESLVQTDAGVQASVVKNSMF
jgi:hypothetical protein